MLLYFRFSNYRSFYDESSFSMMAYSIKEHRCSLINKNGLSILPVSAFYGANASGKSSFFMAFQRMRNVVVDKFMAKESQRSSHLPFSQPFLFDDESIKEPTKYEVSILINEYAYRYGFSCTHSSILTEYLYKKKFSKNETKEKMIFERNGNSFKTGTINKALKSEIDYCASMATDKILLLTDIGLRNKEKELGCIFKWFLGVDIISNITQKYMSTNEYCEEFIGDMLADESFENSYKKEYKELICEIDPGIIDVTFEKKTDSEGTVTNLARTIHRFGNNKKTVSINIESDGTKKWMFLSIILILALKEGRPCFIDELDSQLHPLILRKIVKMFTNKGTNPNGAQLVFSAHNIINLDSSDLRRDEIWFVEKVNHKSKMYSLVDFDDGGIRSDLNYGKHYLSGRFGSVPYNTSKK